MAVTLEKLCKQAGFLYKMKLVAGETGFKNIVQWVHIIEDEDVSNFLHGNELVFTTGIACGKASSLTSFVRKMYKNDVSGVVINIGPYVSTIPREVIQYCNQEGLPLFSVPWETKLVDVTRNFCRRIMQSEQVEENIVSIFKDIIFLSKDPAECVPVLERRGFHAAGNYTILAIYNNEENQNASTDARLKFYVEKIASKFGDLSVTFGYERYRIVILSDYTKQNFENLMRELERQYFSISGKEYFIGISSTQANIDSIPRNFKRAIATVVLSIRMKKHILCYDELGIYQILLEAWDYAVLRNFYDQVFSSLIMFDAENGTNYCEFVKIYIENRGSIQLVADKMLVHRNTVNYQISRIKKITGLDLTELEVKLKFLLCLYIKNII